MIVAKVLGTKRYERVRREDVNHERVVVAFWVNYCVVRDGKIEHQGERLVPAKDELELFQVLPEQLIKRHNVDSIEWICEV